jgi:tRNA A-37 threonylcarbamoyl transferase component Bud32
MKIEIDGQELKIVKHIGKGKGGNSYLARLGDRNVVYKQMHYEPCDTYTFEDNKLQSELRDYKTLKSAGVAMPEMIYYDDQKQFLVKSYIDGLTIAEIVGKNALKDSYVKQMFEMCGLLYANNLNIDYFPTNFVVEGEKLYYIDYECNGYMEEWDFETWGIYFWANSSGMAKFIETGDHKYLSENAKPHKQGLEGTVARLMELKNNIPHLP